jgi:hypothetical protein
VLSDRRVEIPAVNADGSEAVDAGGPFRVGDTLTIYQAAMVYSGRHPGGRFVEGAGGYDRASIDQHELFLGRGAREGPQKLAWDVYCELLRRVVAGEIKPIKAAYTPAGAIDPRDTVIATADVAALARERNESLGYLAPWMRERPRKKRIQPQREQAKQLILQRYGDRVPSEQDVSLGKLYQDCLEGQGDVRLSKDTFHRARDELLAEPSQSRK